MADNEYIERERILKHLSDEIKAFGDPNADTFPFPYSAVLSMKYAKSVVATAPAADVAPVVHAEWITEDNTEGYRGDPQCTACKYILLDEAVYGCTPGVDDYFYCPNCGAKMDGGKHG